jgi:hypothetical protein
VEEEGGTAGAGWDCDGEDDLDSESGGDATVELPVPGMSAGNFRGCTIVESDVTDCCH